MADADIIVTEIMYDADNAVPDNNYEWVEIANTGPDPVSLNGWTLDDVNTGNAGVGIIPNVTIGAGQIAIFYNANITEAEFIAQYSPTPGTVLIPVTHWQPLNNAGGDTVNLFNSGGTTIETVAYPDDAGPGQSLNYTETGVYEGAGVPDPGVVCFTAGSHIKTENGDIPIEALQAGDLVLTKDHSLQPLRWIGHRIVSPAEQIAIPNFRPVIIQKSAIADNVPCRNMRVSQQHRILIESHQAEALFGRAAVLCAAVSLDNDHSITIQKAPKRVEYIHLLFDQHEIVFVDRLASESFHPCPSGINKLSAKAQREIYALFPELKDGKSMALAYPALNAVEAAILGV